MVGEDIVDISRYTTAPCAVGVFQSLDDLHEIGGIPTCGKRLFGLLYFRESIYFL